MVEVRGSVLLVISLLRYELSHDVVIKAFCMPSIIQVDRQIWMRKTSSKFKWPLQSARVVAEQKLYRIDSLKDQSPNIPIP